MACGILVRGVQKSKEWLNVVTFVLQNANSQLFFMDKVKKVDEERFSTTSRVVTQSVQDESEYY